MTRTEARLVETTVRLYALWVICTPEEREEADLFGIYTVGRHNQGAGVEETAKEVTFLKALFVRAEAQAKTIPLH